MAYHFKKSEAAADELVKWTLIAVGGYLALKLLQTTVAVGEGVTAIASGTKKALNSLGSAIGSGLFDLFWPASDQVGEMLFYTVTFPDGARHAIASGSVNGGGQFTYNNIRWQMLIEKSSKMRYAVPYP